MTQRFEVWFVESCVETELFAIEPSKKDAPNVNATRCHYEALVFGDKPAAQAWIDAQDANGPPWHAVVYTFETGEVH